MGSWPADERPGSLVSEAPDDYQGCCLSQEYPAKSSTDPSSGCLENFNLGVENFFLFFSRRECKYNPPLPQIIQLSFPRLGKLSGSAHRERDG